MNRLVSLDSKEPWRRRLYLPAYQIKDAARYADISSATVTAWHRGGDLASAHLSRREERTSLSYLQLVEVAIVAALRKAGVKLQKIRATRDYCSAKFKSEYPFAEHKFKTDGAKVMLDCFDIDHKQTSRGKVIAVSEGGQLGWKSILSDKLTEFEYDAKRGLAVRWHVAGKKSPILIDPQVSFGAPQVKGVPTWVLKGRHEAGESLEDIQEDFQLKEADVVAALKFEGVDPRAGAWSH